MVPVSCLNLDGDTFFANSISTHVSSAIVDVKASEKSVLSPVLVVLPFQGSAQWAVSEGSASALILKALLSDRTLLYVVPVGDAQQVSLHCDSIYGLLQNRGQEAFLRLDFSTEATLPTCVSTGPAFPLVETLPEQVNLVLDPGLRLRAEAAARYDMKPLKPGNPLEWMVIGEKIRNASDEVSLEFDVDQDRFSLLFVVITVLALAGSAILNWTRTWSWRSRIMTQTAFTFICGGIMLFAWMKIPPDEKSDLSNYIAVTLLMLATVIALIETRRHRPNTHLQGRFRDKAGNPVVGRIEAMSTQHLSKRLFSCRTAPDGKYDLYLAGDDVYQIAIIPDTVTDVIKGTLHVTIPKNKEPLHMTPEGKIAAVMAPSSAEAEVDADQKEFRDDGGSE